jgi:hypothetical protein
VPPIETNVDEGILWGTTAETGHMPLEPKDQSMSQQYNRDHFIHALETSRRRALGPEVRTQIEKQNSDISIKLRLASVVCVLVAAVAIVRHFCAALMDHGLRVRC